MDILPASGDEDMGYDTQKLRALLERIIEASSNPGDVVFDPFCGCATTLEAAHMKGRQWIGIDIAIHAVKRVARVRLEQRLGLVEGRDFTIEGVPRTEEGARDLWKRDPAMMAGLIVLNSLPERQGRNFEREMAAAGGVEILGIEYPRMQILSVPDLLDGRRFHTPSVAGKNILEPQLPGLPRH